jgi:hypothetical protein
VAPTRREFFLSAGAIGATACVGEVEDDMTQGLTGMPGPEPWRMWGSSEIVTVDAAGATEQRQGQQLASIQYKRPETWSFLLAAHLLDGPIVALDQDFEVLFNLTVGLGRSVQSLGIQNVPVFTNDSTFARFRWRVPAGQRPGTRQFSMKWTSTTATPPLDDVVGATSARNLDWFVAQTIQCVATVVVPSASLGPVRFQVASYFSPRSHVRPDWFADGPASEKFRGGERGGT